MEGAHGHAKGHAAIRELFVGFQQAISFSHHGDQRVDVNGDTPPPPGISSV
jgi:hypothetical protein